jgi:hypothetical protein
MANLQGVTIPAPTAGLSLVDPIDDMDPRLALELSNLTFQKNSVSMRRGYTSYASTGEGLQIQTLVPQALSNGTTNLIGTAGTKIWRFTSGTATNITGGTSLTNAVTNCDTFGQNLYICNGADTVQVYNGTATANSTFTGATLTDLINVSSYKERIYFVEKNSLKFWYGNTSAVGASALTAYNLQYFMKQGGYLLFAGSYTNQTAQTSQDLFFACSSEGELLLYSGSSPADTAWALVARYLIGKPLGFQAFIRVNNDVWILTRQGIIPLSALFASDTEAALDTVGRNINPIFAQYSAIIPFSHLWRGIYHAAGRKVYITVPTAGDSTFLLVYSMDNKGWSVFNLFSANDSCSIAVADESLYFGSKTGAAYLGDTGYNDRGNAITISGRLPFNFFGSRGNYKAFKDVRPLMRTQRGISLNLGFDTDFKRTANLDTLVSTAGIYTPWGSAWGSPWSSDVSYIYDRYATKGQGHCAALRFTGSVKDAPLELYGFEVRFDLGGQV